MTVNFNEITPLDLYLVKINEPIDSVHISNLIDLYQSVLGSDAIGFYFSLLNHIPLGQAGLSKASFHRQLMIQLQLPLSSVIKARKILEAVGLLRTVKFKHKVKDEYIYEYLLYPPLKPVQYFQSDVLSLLLLNRIGKKQFQVLKEKYIPQKEWNTEFYVKEKEITRSFDEVFDSVLASELKTAKKELESLLHPYDGKVENNPKQISINNEYLDMDFIRGMVTEIYQPQKIEKETEKLLQELAFLYQLSEIDILNLLKDQAIYNNAGNIDENLIRKRLREKYQFEKKEIIIHNKEDISANINDKAKTKTDSKAVKHKWILENYSPIELLEQYQGGGKIAESDLVLIEGLINGYKLSQGVVNVLIEYVMLTNEYKLPRKLTEKIAAHWRRLKINTVEQALALAKKEHQIYKEWKETGQREKNKTTTRKTNTSNNRKEKIPDYILQQEQKYHQNQNNNNDEIDAESKEEIEKLLKELGEI